MSDEPSAAGRDRGRAAPAKRAPVVPTKRAAAKKPVKKALTDQTVDVQTGFTPPDLSQLAAEYERTRREDAEAQRTLMTITSIAVAISAALFTFVEGHATVLTGLDPSKAGSKALAWQLWLGLPLIPISLVGWILYQAHQIRLNRGYLGDLEMQMRRLVPRLDPTDKGVLANYPIGVRLREVVGRPTQRRQAHVAALATVYTGMAVFMLLFGGSIGLFLLEAWHLTKDEYMGPNDVPRYYVVGFVLIYGFVTTLAISLLGTILRDRGKIYQKSRETVLGEPPPSSDAA